ncbi:hypothetical protein WMY93_013906 [Mugilogobius chulae]|uniref:Ig-like domain-containing protein n=1 Tax=Mugilogobius chulae TaxID=88201 RepID=A0AAW0PAB5_9GOBI
MASLRQIIGYSMVIIIIACAGIIIIYLAAVFAGRRSSVHTLDKSPVGNLGENQLLSCYLSVAKLPPPSQMSVSWTKSGVSGVVYQLTNGAVDLEKQNEQFKGRTTLSIVDLKTGNASLLLTAVRNQDQGEYTCTVSSRAGAGAVTVTLRTGAPSFTSSENSLSAVAERWFPEPSVSWSGLNGTVNGTTSLTNNSAGVYHVETSLAPINRNETYILRIQNDLKISVSRATVTDSGVTHETYLYNTNKASSQLLSSTQLTLRITILFIGLATFPYE